MLVRTFAVIALMVPFVNGATYYLDNSAAGPSFDGTVDNPWQTVAQAQAYLNNLSDGGSGDTVLVAAGDSSYGNWVDGAFSGDGFTDLQEQQVTRTDWLVIKALDSRNPPEFYHLRMYGGRDSYMEFNGLHVLSRAPHVYSECVHVRNAVRHVRLLNLDVEAEITSSVMPDGIYIDYQYPRDILVEGCEIHHLTTGLPVSGDTLIIRNNTIHHIAASAVKSAGNRYTLVEGNHIHTQVRRVVRLYLHGAVSGTFTKGDWVTQEVTGAKGTVYTVTADRLEVTPVNKVEWEFLPGYAVNADSHSAAVAALDTVTLSDASHGSGLSVRTYENYIARGNVIHDYGSTAGIFLYPTDGTYKNVLFENNLVYDALTRTMVVNDLGENVVVRNNTLIGGFQVYAEDGYNGSGLIFHNNIATNFTAYYDSIMTTVVEGNNIIGDLTVRSPRSAPDQLTAGSSSIILEADGYGGSYFTDSLFVDYSGKDFRLKEGTIAVDFGDAAHAPDFDLNGFMRSGTPDAGCFEYGSTAEVRSLKSEPGSQKLPFIPNPASMAEILAIDGAVYGLNGRQIDLSMQPQNGMYIIVKDNDVKTVIIRK